MSAPAAGGEDLERLEVIARDALVRHDYAADARLELLSLSENATYRVDDADRPTAVLRVHRLGYHSREAIDSELAWVAALRADDVVRTAAVIPDARGELVGVGRHPDGEQRHAVLFEWLPGREPDEHRLLADFETLGAIAARLHAHARGWTPPPSFTRFRWDYETSLGSAGHWGRWQDGVGVDDSALEHLGRLAACLRGRLAAFGSGPERFGLVHADMRLANLLVDDAGEDEAGRVAVIDFDDCGFGWYLYDVGSSLSFIEHSPLVPELLDAWCRGYRTQAQLGNEEEAELATFVMLRRLLLVAWIGSHRHTDLAKSMGAEFTRTSCDLAEQYLSRFG